MNYEIILIHDKEENNRVLQWNDWELAEKSFCTLAKSLADPSRVGNFSLSLYRMEDKKLMFSLAKSLS